MSARPEESDARPPTVIGGSAERPTDETPATLAMQPMPLTYTVAHKQVGTVTMTAVMRNWRAGDPGRCRLCPAEQCVVNRLDTCLVLFPRYIDARDAKLAPLILAPGDRPVGIRIGYEPDRS